MAQKNYNIDIKVSTIQELNTLPFKYKNEGIRAYVYENERYYFWNSIEEDWSPEVNLTTNLNINQNAIYVDSLAGDDLTGEKHNFNKPFKTIEEAFEVAESNDLIIVLPGDYEINDSISKDGVDWFFYPGTTVILNNNEHVNGIWDDLNYPMSFKVAGYGNFIRETNDDFLSVKLVNVTNSNSNIIIEADELKTISGSDGESSVIYQSNGIVYINSRLISSFGGNSYSIWWINGKMDIYSTKVYSDYSCIISSVTTSPTGDCHLKSNELEGQVAIGVNGTNGNAAIWVKSNIIKGNIQSNNINKLYVECQKIFDKILTSDTAGLVYIKTDKITDIGNGLITILGGMVRLTVLHLDPANFLGEVLVLGGELQLNNADYIGTANSIGVETRLTGILKMTNCNINTSLNSSTNPIIKTGGTIILKFCILKAENSRSSVFSSTSQTLISYASYANKAVDNNITISGLLTVGAYVQ